MWQGLLEILISEPDFECLTRTLQEHMAAIRIWDAQREAQLQDTSGRGCAWYADQSDNYGRPVAHCTQAYRLVKGIDAEYLLANKGYDSDALVDSVQQAGINPIIPPSKSRKNLLYYDKYLSRLRHHIEIPSWN